MISRYNKLVKICQTLKNVPNGKNKHFTFFLLKNKVVSMGWNNSWKTHPMAKLCGYRFDCVHSELSCFLRYRGDTNDLKNCTVVNVRVNNTGGIGYSKPCCKCSKLLQKIGYKKLIYIDRLGNLIVEAGQNYNRVFGVNNYDPFRV